MKLIDISIKNFNGMSKYPSLEDYKHEVLKDYSLGDQYSLSKIAMPMHIGTHVDAPYHFIEDGIKIQDIPLETFYGQCAVIEIDAAVISQETLSKKKITGERILFKTNNSTLQNKGEEVINNVYIDKSGSEYLSKLGIKLIGIDYFSVDNINNKIKDAHKILLSKGVILLEGINLYGVDEGEYIISCFPLNVMNSEGSPCRAILIK